VNRSFATSYKLEVSSGIGECKEGDHGAKRSNDLGPFFADLETCITEETTSALIRLVIGTDRGLTPFKVQPSLVVVIDDPASDFVAS
jgi:hypothetical protein